jgi:hypothetical protein
VRCVPSAHERPGGALPSWTRRPAVVTEFSAGLVWMLHSFLYGGVAIAWRFAERVLDGLEEVWCWLDWIVSADGLAEQGWRQGAKRERDDRGFWSEVSGRWCEPVTNWQGWCRNGRVLRARAKVLHERRPPRQPRENALLLLRDIRANVNRNRGCATFAVLSMSTTS